MEPKSGTAMFDLPLEPGQSWPPEGMGWAQFPEWKRNELQKRYGRGVLLEGLPHAGLWTLTLHDAAVLLTNDMWFQGEFSAAVPESTSYDPSDPRLTKHLESVCSTVSERLLTAIEHKDLKSQSASTDLLTGRLIPQTVRIGFDELLQWAAKHGHSSGPAFAQFSNSRSAIYTRLLIDAGLLLDAEDAGGHFSDVPASNAQFEMLAQAIEKSTSLRQPVDVLPAREKPLSVRERENLLRIIAALVRTMLDKSPSNKPCSVFETQDAIYDALLSRFAGGGLAKRTLQEKVAEGNRLLGA